MAYYTGKDTTDAFSDPDYERLRRDRNLLSKRLEVLDKENTKLKMEVSANKAKLVTFNTLCEAIDKFVTTLFIDSEQDATEYIKYLYEIAHKWDENVENNNDYGDEINDNMGLYDDCFDETTDILKKCD